MSRSKSQHVVFQGSQQATKQTKRKNPMNTDKEFTMYNPVILISTDFQITRSLPQHSLAHVLRVFLVALLDFYDYYYLLCLPKQTIYSGLILPS